LYGHNRAALYVRQDFDPLTPETYELRQLLPHRAFKEDGTCTHLFSFSVRIIAHLSRSREIRISDGSKVSLRLISPGLVQANIKDSRLFEIAIDAFTLYIVFHFFDLTSLERRHMLRDSRAVGL
jgi:hypothetical protein